MEKIIFLNNPICLDFPEFNYLGEFEKGEIKERLENKTSYLVSVSSKYYAVIDLEKDAIHVREVAGNFYRNIMPLFFMVHGLAKYLKKDFITLVASKKAVGRLAKKVGFELQNDMYIKAV